MSQTEGDRYVVSDTDIDPETHEHGSRCFRQYRLSHATVGVELGASLYEVAPGYDTWPAHYHTGNEEAVVVLDGQLRLFLGCGQDREEFRLDPGDYVALPTGPAQTHELGATGDDTARFLVVSTMQEPDVTLLTDDGKVHLVAGDPPGEYENRYVSRTLDGDAQVPYWEKGRETADTAERPENGETDPESETDDTSMRGDRETEPHGRSDEQSEQDDDSDTENATAHVADPPISRASDRDWTQHDYSDRGREGHQFGRTQLGQAAGGEQLGASLYEVPSGKRAWLPHYHLGNAEAAYVLTGEGQVSLGVDRTERTISRGDYVALPSGEAGYHDIIAGDDGLRYLLVSTMNEPDVTVYPDDGRVGIYGGSAPGGADDERTVTTYLDADAEVEYWAG
jgi:uncharacterized cupin superfamily protein